MEPGFKWTAAVALAATAVGFGAGARAATAAYPQMAPLAQYRSVSAAEEIAMARSAAPASIADKAEVRVMTATGYETAVKGSNGFVCLVERSWADGFEDPQFWNPKVRSPQCFNAVAARAVLPIYLERTRQVLHGGLTHEGMAKLAKAEAAHAAPPAGAVCFMMSKQGYLADGIGHAHPHVMLFIAPTPPAAWGANLPASPVGADRSKADAFTTIYVTVPKWSDGTPGMDMH